MDRLTLLLLLGFLHVVRGQRSVAREHSGPWTQRVQWTNNGHVFNLLSTGSRYQVPEGPRGQARVSVTRQSVRALAPAAPMGATPDGTVGAGRQRAQRVAGPPGARRGFPAGQAAQPRGGDVTWESGQGATGRAPGDGRSEQHGGRLAEDMLGDDPRNPLNSHRNAVFYDMYPSGRRRASGHGTGYFQHGLPDLVPDPYYIQASTYVQRVPMYALRCAAEENCLARSAYRPGVRDVHHRVLLRFPQRVKNQGTADFLPFKPRHQWEWHSCHQHFHSMDAFSNYDLLEASAGRKVAEGHKASFCLEDTSCEPGFRRRYACTAHTQGLSPGCYDTYNADIDCQWIDITDVPPGRYVLKVSVNPTFQVPESDFSNNVVRCDVVYTGSYVQARNCRITGG
ncbi:protein-lysine 6-oxidase-like isoform X2 [Scleropages formosus]|nr:protein-lysine 6-oxidase-like isoform X2 [Scleropages formosus]